MKVLAIVGSPRINGNTSYLVDLALNEIAVRGFETEKINLSQHRVNPCLAHEDCAALTACKQQDDAPWILDKFINADGVILASPVYYYNMSAQMKAFVDRNFFFYTHKRRIQASCAGLIAIAGGGGTDHAIRALRRLLNFSANIPDDRLVIVEGLASKPGVVKNNPALVAAARDMGQRLAEMLASV